MKIHLALSVLVELMKAGKGLALYVRPDILVPVWLPA